MGFLNNAFRKKEIEDKKKEEEEKRKKSDSSRSLRALKRSSA